jgi:hypothetical protein
MKKLLACAAVTLFGCGVNEAKIGEQPQDLGEEGSELSASIPLIQLGERQLAAASFDSSHKYIAYEFFGHAGDVVNVFADGEGKANTNLDTTLALYKVSFISGRPYGASIAYNDDTNTKGWSPDQYASSIDSFKLPQDRNYAIVVSTYQHAHGTAQVQWAMERQLGALAFPGSGSGTAVTLLPSTAATLLPMSAELNDAMTHFTYGPGHTEAARLKVAPSALAAITADRNALGVFAYEVLYDRHGGASYQTAGTTFGSSSATAVRDLETTIDISQFGVDSSFIDENIKAVLAAMFADHAFATSSVQVWRIHFDNGDDMSSDGILSADPATGEVRMLAVYSDP